MKIIILGAAGQISRQLTERLLKETTHDLTLFARNADTRLQDYAASNRVTLISGDLTDQQAVTNAIAKQDLVYLDFDRLPVVSTVISAMDTNHVKRLIIAGALSIYNEVVGEFGRWNKRMMGEISPERREMINKIENSDLDYTYMRMTWLYNQIGNTRYFTMQKGEQFRGAQVTRQAITQYVLDLIADPTRDLRASVGIAEPGTEDYPKPSFY
ncbi:NAD(P)H-binding protein [Oenococcus kitaharae]|uniref:Saccharopine dehydrogenase related protein n=1 Tax=Oenococcus kitaharae DSM 17330 TaxID=1045004 RepID=G9WJK4_9LACO|nr:NAD(P)H-binding protein [Oenococcus kitaharae]EHN59049.1 Saccharopine dehydrogenase related protein [Oenococcus kitaharae DSM 17330]OEY83726.1 saccharopine dehydrogenase [Oenococcus kitaharae]OEY83898.1 saccharopine dehydrogenase [Oenococcus kitaharae]OEY84174.1 saccharopine dehydrogenase [Oenococcus kitaharae]